MLPMHFGNDLELQQLLIGVHDACYQVHLIQKQPFTRREYYNIFVIPNNNNESSH